MTQHKDRKTQIRARMAATGEPYTEAARHVGEAAGPPLAADSTGEHLAWSGPDWYAFPPEPPPGTGLGLGNGRNQRYYWDARRRWAPWQVRQHARMAAELTGGRARHLAGWYPEGWAPYHGDTRDLALELLYVITLHDWPGLAPDPARLAALIAAGDPAPVDAAFAEFDRHARLLTGDGLHPPTGELAGQATSILQQQAASTSWRERENAQRVLGQLGRAMTPLRPRRRRPPAGDRHLHARRAGHSRRDAVQLARRLPARDRGQLPRPGRPRAGRGTAVRMGPGRRPARPLRPGLVPASPRRRLRNPPGRHRSRLGGGTAAADDRAVASLSAPQRPGPCGH